jgi:DNA-binding transcriptional LysR family regulator
MRLGGVTRAAEELALAQSTVSGLLKKLSDTMGAPLLHARGGRIELTDAGEAVARLCEEILESLHRFEEERCRTVPDALWRRGAGAPGHVHAGGGFDALPGEAAFVAAAPRP